MKCPNCEIYDFSLIEKLRIQYRWRECPECFCGVKLTLAGRVIFGFLAFPLVLGSFFLGWLYSNVFVGLFSGLVAYTILEICLIYLSGIMTRPGRNTK